MEKIEIYSWKKEFYTISLIQLIRAEFGLGLKDGKEIVDKLLETGAATFEFPDTERANKFMNEATALGAICRKNRLDAIIH